MWRSGQARSVGSSISRTCGSTARRAGYAEPLLLSSREPESVLFEPVLHLVPYSSVLRRSLFDYLVKDFARFADAVRTRTVSDVVVNAHRERIRLLEDHSDLPAAARSRPPTGRRCSPRGSFTSPVIFTARNKVVHPVEGFQKCRLSASGGTDKRGYAFFGDIYIDVFKSLSVPVPETEILYRDNVAHMLFLFLKYFPTRDAARFMRTVSIMSIAAIANATSNSPCSFA